MHKASALLGAILALPACNRSGEAESQDSTIAEQQGVRTPRRRVDPRTPAQESSPTPTVAEVAKVVAEPLFEASVIQPDRPIPPSDYGLIQPSDGLPDESALTYHALAGYEVVAIYDKPDSASPKLGYLRLGARTKVTARVEGTGCSKSWYQLPQGGYACSGRGLVVEKSKQPFLKDEPPPPRLDQAFPYDYGLVKTWNTPLWWRVPTAAESVAASKKRRALEAVREGKPLPEATPQPAAPVVATAVVQPKAAEPKVDPEQHAAAPEPTLEGLPGPDGKAVLANAPTPPPSAETPGRAEPPAPVAAATPVPPAAAAVPAVPEEPEVQLPLHLQTPWLERGFYVSLGEQFVEDGKSWWRTSRGAVVEADSLAKYNVKDFAGAVLEEGADFPFGYVMVGSGTKLMELTDDGKLKAVGTLENRTFVDLSEETEIGGTTYMMTTEGQFVRKGHIRFAEPQPMPEGLQPWERWVDVSLGKQMLVAYEGTRPVFVTLVSTGKKGTKEEPFETPTGRWRIQSKRVSSTMDGAPEDGSFSIEDVPWTMYFEGNYALHGAFWHDGFGRVRSHGCVNLGASDARWLFFWTTPYLPDGWHGVQAHEGSPGSTVVVHD